MTPFMAVMLGNLITLGGLVLWFTIDHIHQHGWPHLARRAARGAGRRMKTWGERDA